MQYVATPQPDINDLSRGASIEDIIDVTYITAAQAIAKKGAT